MLRIFLHVILTTALLATGFNAAAEPPSGQHEKWVKGQILVQPKAGLSPERFKKLLASEGADSAGSVPGTNVHIISVPPGAEDKVIKALSHNPNIEFAEKDFYLQPNDYTPNDPRFVDAWHLQTMNLPGAWDISRGDAIIIAVVDSGVNGAHKDLSGKMVSGRNVASNSSDTSDIAGHGTKVAGIIGAVMDNGLGVASIAPNALIMPIRVTNDPNGWASTSTLATGITWAADNGARVANVSYNISSSSVISTAADHMRSLGGLVVVSAGNNGTNQTFADSESIIAVSATTRNDVRASWSNYGNFIDVAAPGVRLWTTNSSGGYASASGTSFAAPATAATVALIMATNPSLSPVEVEAVLENSAVDLGDPGFDPVFGNGRVDALAAVLLAGGQTPVDNEPPTVAFANPQDGAAVSGLVVINATVSDDVGTSKVELFDDQGLVGTDFSAPYSFGWNSARIGEGMDAALSLVTHDNQGNFGTQSITVHVNDTTPPVISVPGNRTVEATGPLTAVAPGSASATDNVDGSVTVTPDSTGPFSVGTSVITWTARDSANNTATASQTITVRDTTPPSGQHEKWVKGQILVQHKAGLSPERFKKLLASEGADSAGSVPGTNVHIISVPPGAEDKVIKALSHNPNIEFCEKDLYLQPTDYTPNDPKFVDAWHLQTMNLPGAWDISRGDAIIVAVVDSGVNGAHEDLSGKMVSGRNVASNSSDTSDIAGHGTKVAGVIGAVMDNGLGVASIAPNALIMPIRVTNDPNGWASTSTLATGITWAADNGARVANVSFNISSSSVISTAADHMRSLGGLVVVSAGNNGTNQTFADRESIIAVSATTSNDVRASWSNYGNFIDVAAPGVGLWTTNSSGGYASVSGTSFAAPATAATIALIMSANPSLSPVEVEWVLESSAVDLGDPGFDPVFGNGRVDALAAVLLAGGQTPIDNEPPTVAFANPQDGAAVSGLVVINATASDNVGISKVELFDDQGLVGTDFSAPYSFSWDSSGKAGGAQVILIARAHDDAGNSRDSSITVSIIADDDTVAPVVTAPSAVTREATGPLTSVNLGSASAVDAVDGAVTVTANFSGPFAVGQHTVVWSATDVAGNTGTANQSVRITDTTAPVVTAPANIIVQASGGSTSVNLGQGSAQDKVDGSVSATPNNSGPFPVGVTIVSWRATDSSGNTGSATQTVTVSEAEDVTPPVISAPSNKTVEATGSLTSVNLGQATAVDDVDSTVSVSASDQGPFEVGVHNIIWTARDQAGNQSTANQTVTVRDTTRPVISIPGDVTVGATGPLTEVNLGNVTAFDTVSGSITPVVNPAGPYTSGVHTLSWSATDAAGNRRSATQKLTVKPQASLAVNQTVGEGSTVTVDVFLSGPAPAYPVSIPYTVGGTADRPADHNATDGVITINSGTTGSRVFTTVDDGFNGEDNETVVFEIQTPTNAVLGTRRKHTVTIIEGNAPPRVDLEVRQQGAAARVVYTDAGLVEVIAGVTDSDANDRHSFDWSETDNRLFDTGTGGADTFIFDPQALAEGVYSVKVTVTDNGEPAESVAAEALISVSQPESTSPARDQDGDGISDDEEGTGDTDQDGVPDYLDAIDDPAVLQSIEAVSDRALLITEPGLSLRLGGTALAAGYYGASISLRDIEAYANQAGGGVSASVESGLEFPGGLYDFEVTGLRQTGQSVKVVIPQAAKIGADAVYRKYLFDTGWQDFVEDAGNSVASAAGSRDSCPAPGSSDYKPGLQQGHYCVQLTLQDGGANDADGRANGVIKDPGGVALSPQAADNVTGSTSSGGGGGGGGGGCAIDPAAKMDPLWIVLLLIPAIGIQRRRLLWRRRQGYR